MKLPASYASTLFAAALITFACANNTGSGSEKTNTPDSTTNAATTDEGTPTEFTKINVSDITLTLPKGFTATEVTPGLGHARHLFVNNNGDIYVKMDDANGGKSVVLLKDTNGDGVADQTSGFGDYGGTGVTIKNGYLYTTSNTEVFRYKLDAKGQVENTTAPQRIVTGLSNKGDHPSKSIALDNNGNIYVTIGSTSNACQVKNRTPGSPALDPCPELETNAGIWQFKADKTDQSYKEGLRYATGIRNAVGVWWNTELNQLFATQHGRDQLTYLFPNMYDAKQSAELPAEELLAVKKGSNFGWPYCYYDQFQSKKILAPEYGGDSKKQGRCEGVDAPVMGFPGHMAPNDLLFYTGKQFPSHYRQGAFIAFHGSWNRSPEEQKGFFVAFIPFKNGKPSGNYEVFADGFAGITNIKGPGQAKHRPVGLAVGPDGALYISDSVKGTVWKITYKG